MRVFLTQQIDNNEELRTQLGWAESKLATIWIVVADSEKALRELQEGMQAEKAEARRMGEEKEVVEAKCKVVE